MEHFEVGVLATRLVCPLLIFHGMLDETVPYMQSISFLQTARHADIELRLYKDGDHRLLKYKEEMAEAACSFFSRHVSRK
jgi:dipeptidyl aminopeptidase/acylaminoacyl peptidase